MGGIFEIISLFHKGGLVMYPLLACSVLVIAIAVERMYYFKQSFLHKMVLERAITESIKQANWQEAEQQCQRLGGVLGRILAQGLIYQRDSSAMQSAFEESAALESARLRQNLQHLSTVVTLAPLLGLLGTVIGMIGSFQVLDAPGGNPAAITGGVGEALIATAAGLCVAVLALVVHSYFSHRLDNLLTDIESICATVLRGVRRSEP